MPGFVLAALAKPLPAFLLALYAYRSGARGTRLLAAGLLAAAAGDEFLLVPTGMNFVYGMACFALMHLAYIAAFRRRGARVPVPRGAVLGYGVVLIVASVALAPHTGALRIPVMAYSLLLMVMAARALTMPRPAAAGAALFVVSDMTLAFSTFIPSFPLPPAASSALVLGTYYAAQLLITWGMTNAAIQKAAHDQTLAEKGAGHL